MPLHPQAEAFLAQLAAENLPAFDEMSVLEARAADATFDELQGEPVEIAEVRDVLAPGGEGEVPVRIYDPEPGVPLPLIIYFHGGGWLMGSIDVVDKPCRSLAAAANCVVASVGYRLAPETKFPGGLEDCYAATTWLAAHATELGADGKRLIVSGDSSGANLAAAVALMARDRNGPEIAYQLLIYPVTAPARGSTFASYTDNGEGYMLTKGGMEWFWDHYLAAPEDGENPYASPLLAEDHSGLPPAFVLTAEFDPLRDEGIAYAQQLIEAGVPVRTITYDGAIHGFFWMSGVLEHGQQLTAELGEFVRAELHSQVAESA